MLDFNFKARAASIFRGSFLIAALHLVVGIAPVASQAQAPEPTAPPKTESARDKRFLEDTPNERLSASTSAVRGMCKKEARFGSGQQALFDDYFENYEFKRWTQSKNFGSLASFRSKLDSSFRSCGSGQVHDRLNELVLEFMGSRVKKNYYPAFRVSAMLTIAELNSAEASGRNNPTPLPAALTILLEAVGDAQQLDAVKVAALTGIKRHVVLGVNDAAITKALVKVIASPGTNDPGKDWIRMQAVEILGLLKSPGEGNQVAKAILAILQESKAPPSLRCTAAEALGQMNLSNASGLKASELIAAMSQLLRNGCETELESVKTKDFPVSRRRMKTYLGAVTAGLGESSKNLGAASLAKSPEDKKLVTDLQAILKDLLTTLDNENLSNDAVEKAVNTTLKKLGGSN